MHVWVGGWYACVCVCVCVGEWYACVCMCVSEWYACGCGGGWVVRMCVGGVSGTHVCGVWVSVHVGVLSQSLSHPLFLPAHSF